MTKDSAPARWAIIAAWAVPLCVLPSAIWRILNIGEDPDATWYLLSLSAGSMLLSLLTVGLVRSWGERVPHWIPGIGGHTLPPRLVAGIASTGAMILIVLSAYFVYNWFTLETARTDLQLVGNPGTDTRPLSERDQATEVVLTYAPMLAWGPLVLTLAVDYWRRHRPRARRQHA
ncbi:hypothetical protein ABZ639_15100 [Saccharomonospora sp. NPDC006951]